MTEDKVRVLTERIDENRQRLQALGERSRGGTQRLSEVSGNLLAHVTQLDATALAALEALDLTAHAREFQAAVESHLKRFREDFDRVVVKLKSLPERIEALASGETLETVDQSLMNLRGQLIETFDNVASNVADILVTDAFVNAAEAMPGEFEASASLMRKTAAETTTRLEALAETMVAMAEGIDVAAESAGEALAESWTNRAEIMEAVFEDHAVNVSERIKALEAQFETVRDRLVKTFAILSTLRIELTDLSTDNAGPAETLADVLSTASEALSAVG